MLSCECTVPDDVGGRLVPPEVSVVVPCHNESATLGEVVDTLRAEFGAARISYEIVLVDDGSEDDSLDVMRALHSSVVSYLSFSRNFGKESAMLAGLRAARGQSVVFIDADLQHPPSLVPRMVESRRATGVDQVIAMRDRSGDPRLRQMSSWLFYRLSSRLMDVRVIDGEGDFRLISRRAADALLSLTETTRFSKGLFNWIGFPRTAITYQNVARSSGRSRWSNRGLADYALDGLMSFNVRPLRFMIHLGLMTVGLFLVYLAWLLANAVVDGVVTPGYITIMASVIFLGGIQLLCIGILGEYTGRIFLETKKRPHYVVSEHGDLSSDTVVIREERVDSDRPQSPVRAGLELPGR